MHKSLKQPFSKRTWLIVSLSVLVISMIVRVLAGTSWLTLPQLWQALIGADSAQNFIVWQLRVPAVIGAILIGCALSTAGLLLKTVTKNPLADPGVLGVSSGAVFAIVFTYVMTDSLLSGLSMSTPIIGFLGALATAFAMIRLASVNGEVDSNRLLLIGIGFSLFFSSLTTYLKSFLSAENFNALTTLIQGNLDTVTWETIWRFGPIILVMLIALIIFERYVHVFALGREASIGIGFAYPFWKRLLLIAAVLLTAISLLFGGAISFLGILGSQIGTRLAPKRFAHQLVFGAIWSAIFVIIADFGSRQLFSFLVPLDTMIAFIGAPVFLFILIRKTTKW